MIKIDEGRGIIVRDINGIHFEIKADYDDYNYGANDSFTVYADGEEIGTAKSRREAFDIMNNFYPRLQVASYKRESKTIDDVTIDMWYDDDVSKVDNMDVSFSDADSVYRGNLYINDKVVGDFSTSDSVALAKVFPQFDWDAYWDRC